MTTKLQLPAITTTDRIIIKEGPLIFSILSFSTGLVPDSFMIAIIDYFKDLETESILQFKTSDESDTYLFNCNQKSITPTLDLNDIPSIKNIKFITNDMYTFPSVAASSQNLPFYAFAYKYMADTFSIDEGEILNIASYATSPNGFPISSLNGSFVTSESLKLPNNVNYYGLFDLPDNIDYRFEGPNNTLSHISCNIPYTEGTDSNSYNYIYLKFYYIKFNENDNTYTPYNTEGFAKFTCTGESIEIGLNIESQITMDIWTIEPSDFFEIDIDVYFTTSNEDPTPPTPPTP